MRNRILRRTGCCWIALAAGLAGCESPSWVRNLNQSFPWAADDKAADEEKHRSTYQATHDRKALYWLLANRLESGMPYGDVCRVLGEEGTRETNDRWIKTNGGNYQTGDETYQFGPDSEGQSIYLVFRENQLVNFDPSEFRAGP